MQPAPFRLALHIRTAFCAAKPSSRNKTPLAGFAEHRSVPKQACIRQQSGFRARFYSDDKGGPTLQEDRQAGAESPLQNAAGRSSRAKPDASTITPEPASSPPPNGDDHNDLPSRIRSRRSDLSKRFSHIMDNLQSNIFTASQRLNDLTGYSGIEALKRDIEAQEEKVQSTRRAVKDARSAYSTAVATRSTTQREVNDLLQRKHTWSPSDLERFTSLYRNDHANEQTEAKAQEDLGRAEREAEEASTRLARTILARYHEEQIWSDKIRQMSTWGTWGLMGVNVLLFLIFQIAVEPWRRKRLVKGFEEKVMDAIEREKGALTPAGAAAVAAHAGEVVKLELVPTPSESLAQPEVSEPDLAADVGQQEVEAAIEEVAMQEDAEGEDDVNRVPQLATAVGLDAQAVLADTPPASAVIAEPASGYAYYQEAFSELFSDKKVTVTQKELTTVAIEGFAAGGAIMGLLLVLLRPR